MVVLVTGGSGSGKSEYAEQLALNLWDKKSELIYLATMIAYGTEGKKRIERHLRLREGKHFTTIEQPINLEALKIPEGSTILLECLSNLAANELFEPNGAKDKTVKSIMTGIESLSKICHNIIIVSNDIFSDGVKYDKETQEYIRTLGILNRQMAERSDRVIEVVYSIPIEVKVHVGGC